MDVLFRSFNLGFLCLVSLLEIGVYAESSEGRNITGMASNSHKGVTRKPRGRELGKLHWASASVTNLLDNSHAGLQIWIMQNKLTLMILCPKMVTSSLFYGRVQSRGSQDLKLCLQCCSVCVHIPERPRHNADAHQGAAGVRACTSGKFLGDDAAHVSIALLAVLPLNTDNLLMGTNQV